MQRIQIDDFPLTPQYFTGRTQDLKELHETCKHQHRVAITGLGGIGKTALALKYGNVYKAHYQFVHFILATSITNELLKLADELHVPSSDRAEERLKWLKTRLDHLGQEYLLIFDGMDRPEAFEEVEKYLPARGGCLLLTSRMPEQARAWNFQIIELQPFSINDAISYLLLATGSKETQKARELAEKLGRFSLALTHAVRYIRSRSFTILEYIKEWDAYDLKVFDPRYLTLAKEEQTVLKTWNISMKTIEQHCLLAKEILSFFAFMGHTPIPLAFAQEWFKRSHPTTESLELSNALRYLYDYSMIGHSIPDAYDVHLLVQKVTRFQMPELEQQNFFEQALEILTVQMQKFKSQEIATWDYGKLCMPHGMALFEIQITVDLVKQYQFLASLRSICTTFGNVNQTLKICQKALKIQLSLWGENHPRVATSYNNIGGALEAQGKYAKALNLPPKSFND